MAMSQLDKVKLMGVIRKKKIECYDDLYIDSHSNLNIYDFLDVTADIAIKFITSDFNEKQIENSLNAIIFVLVKINSHSLSIEDNNTYEKLISLKEYKEKYNDVIGALIDDVINLTTQTCAIYDENYEVEEEVEEETEDQEEIDFEEEYNLSLEQIESLQERVKVFEAQIKSLEKSVAKKEKSNGNLVKRTAEQSGEISKLKKEVQRLKKLLNSENSKNQKYESEITSWMRKLDDSEREKQYLNTKLRDLEEKNSTYQTKTKLYDQSISSKEVYEKNYQRILELLADSRVSVKDIENVLYRCGARLSYREISDIINQIKIRYNVDEKINNFEKTYHIAAPVKKHGLNLCYKTKKKCLDVMIISDAHMGMLSNFDINTINKVYEYMYKNGITHLVDLGDFFSFFSPAGSKAEKVYYCEKVIDEVIEKYPQEKDISHLLLGGNHDEILFRYGLDPLMKLDENRSDFISLGYDYASIKFNRDVIGLYHPDFRLDSMTEQEIPRKIISFSKKVWKDSEIDFDSIYANLYGHFHKLNIGDNGIVMAPSISYDRDRNGAIHMKIYFDSSGKIESITFIKLIIAAKLYDKGKYEYKRSYKK